MAMSRLDAVLSQIDERSDAALARIDRTAQFARESEQLRVEGESSDRVVTVVVDGVGQMVDIRFGRDLDRATAQQLSASVLEAHAQAKRRLSFEVEQLGKQICGEGSPTVQMVSESYRDRFGYEEEDK